ncbi:hypothetical protein ACFL1R_06360 [Candidatus Latescibacterota bacterium]
MNCVLVFRIAFSVLLLLTAPSMAAVLGQSLVTVEAPEPLGYPPAWALLERQVIDTMDRAAPVILERYTNPDGTLMWPTSPDFQSIDALDDAYESVHNWPLFYLLGGDERLLRLAREQFESITRRMAKHDTGKDYPMVVKEYQPAYDWFHQGEGNMLFYMLSMADPADPITIDRARRFAGFFLNEDPGAPNYDPEHKIIRCAHNGSMGPGFWNFDGSPIWTLPGYGLPFYDVPGCEAVEDLNDHEVKRRMGRIASERRGRGDAVVNLSTTTLVSNAYLLTGEEKYRGWVKEYVDAWRERTRLNGGIVPDNVGLSGKIGEHIDGKWYGSNYGWTWPHGWESVGLAVTVAAENAALLLKDPEYISFPRSQVDVLIENGIEHGGVLYIPAKYGDPGKVRYRPWSFIRVLRNEDGKEPGSGVDPQETLGTAVQKNGWFDFMVMHPLYLAHIWTVSQDPSDLLRERKLRGKSPINEITIPAWHHLKDKGGHDGNWLAYLQSEYPDFPEEILRHNLSQVYGRLAFMQRDTENPGHYGDSYFMARNPVTCEGLVQLTMGGPLPLYNGGLLMTQVRYFDADRRRPGLPLDVAALVPRISNDGIIVHLVNLSPDQARSLVVQAGAMGEHTFLDASYMDGADRKTVTVYGRHLMVTMKPATRIILELRMERFVNDPTYRGPWE